MCEYPPGTDVTAGRKGRARLLRLVPMETLPPSPEHHPEALLEAVMREFIGDEIQAYLQAREQQPGQQQPGL